MYRIIYLTLVGAFVLSACTGGTGTTGAPSTEPATVPPTQAAAPTNTEVPEPTATDEPTTTPEPTATPEPQPITAGNASGLALASVTDLGREFLADPRANWNAARWTPDGAYVVVETDRGFDTLDGATLELVYSADGYLPVDMLADGRVAALVGEELVFIDPASGEGEAKGTVSNPGVLAVSPDGSLLAYATGPDTVSLVNLDDGSVTSVTITRRFALVQITDLAFRGDGQVLFVSGVDSNPNFPITLVNVADGTALYEIFSTFPVVPSPDDVWYLYFDQETNASPGTLARVRNDAPEQFLQATFALSAGSFDFATRKGTGGSAADASFVGSAQEWAVLYTGSYAERDASFNTLFSQPAFFILFWNDSGANTATLSDFPDGTIPQSIEFSPDGSKFVTTSSDGSLRLWARDGSTLASAAPYANGGLAALSPDGSMLAIPGTDSVAFVNADDLSPLTAYNYPSPVIPGAANVGGQVHFTGADALVVSVAAAVGAGDDWGPRMTVIYSQSSGEILRSLVHLVDCSISGAGTAILCRNFDNGATQVVRLADGALLTSFKADGISFIHLSNDGNLLSSCRAGAASITVQNLSTGGSRPFNFPCQDVLFLPGDAALLLADGTLVDVETREVIGAFAVPAPYAEFPPAFFSPNGDFAIIGNDVYDFASGALLATLDGYETLYGAALVDDGLTLLLLTDRGLERWSVNQ